MNATLSTFHPADWAQLALALLNYKQPQACQDNANGGQFADILTPLSRACAGSNWRIVSYLWDKYDAGLKNSRQGKLSTAEQVFAEAQEARRPLVTTPLLDCLIDVAALPAIAYLYYKKEQYPEAERLLINSIDSDAELLNEGVYILEYHRVQQLHNLARSSFRQGRLEEGAHMIAMALKFLVYHQVPAVGNGKGWSEEALRQIPDQLRSDMLWQLTSETVGVFLMHPARSYELCQLAFGNMTFWEAQTRDEELMLSWFALTDPRYGGNWQNDLQGAIDFLAKSPSSFDKLKMALVLEFIAVSNQCMPDSTLLQEGVTHFIRQLQLSQAQRETCRLFVGQLLAYSSLNGSSHESNHIFLG